MPSVSVRYPAIDTSAPLRETDTGVNDLIAALDREFDRLGKPESDISEYEKELSPIASLLEQCHVGAAAWGADRSRKFLEEARNLLPAHLSASTSADEEEDGIPGLEYRGAANHVG